MYYYLTNGSEILGYVYDITDIGEAMRIIGYDGDDAELESAVTLSTETIFAYLEGLPSWDYEWTTEELFRELCRRYNVDFDGFEDYDSLYDALDSLAH